jgi:hypothetical protein
MALNFTTSMHSLPASDKLARLRSFLEHLERNPDPCDNADTIESLKHLFLNQIRALELALEHVPTPPDAPRNKKP